MKALVHWFVYGNLWVSLCAAALTMLTYFEHLMPVQLFVLGFVFFSTLIIYNMNMISGLNALREKGTESKRHHWCIDNEKTLKAFTVIGIIGASICFVNLSVDSWFVLVPFVLAAVLYVVPLIGKRGSGTRLREFGLNKIFTIAIVWAAVTVVLPLVNASGVSVLNDQTFWLTVLARTIFIFAITLPFDIRDLKNDKKINVRTIPMVFGVSKTIRMSIVLLAVYGSVALYAADSVYLGIGHLAAALVTAGLVMLTNPNRTDMFYSFTLEGTMVMLPLSVYLFSLLR
ncbi:MAG: 4-hydroxybenzoate polyprenyltransferase [Granulosicoccus sp.]|jgi:4-hydroxybenzoate polyprenyltransferase